MSYEFVCGPGQVLAELCQLRREWGLHIRHVPVAGIGPYELSQAVPFLSEEDAIDFWNEENALLFFTSEDAVLHHLRQVKCDGGPTSLGTYDGPATVRAVACSPLGVIMDAVGPRVGPSEL